MRKRLNYSSLNYLQLASIFSVEKWLGTSFTYKRAAEIRLTADE